MARQRFDTAPEFRVDDDSVVIQQVVGSSAPLLEIKDHSGSTLMSVSATGEMSSPVLTGTPTAPTASSGTNTTQVATTAFVQTEISNLIASAPATLNTLDELAAALNDDANFASTVTTSLSLKAPLASPAFTGTPTAPTAGSGTNDTQIATTAFVNLIANAIIPVGMVTPFAGGTAPSGWVLCFGQELAIASYGSLYAVVGTTYGALTNGSGGAGSTHFRVPDLRGRSVSGEDDMGGSAANRITTGISGINGALLGATGGDQSMYQHSHANTATFAGTANQLVGDHTQTHSHGIGSHRHWISGAPKDDANFSYQGSATQHYGLWSDAGSFTYDDPGYGWGRYSGNPYGGGTDNANQGHQHYYTAAGTVTMSNVNAGVGTAQNMPPTLILNYIIKT